MLTARKTLPVILVMLLGAIFSAIAETGSGCQPESFNFNFTQCDLTQGVASFSAANSAHNPTTDVWQVGVPPDGVVIAFTTPEDCTSTNLAIAVADATKLTIESLNCTTQTYEVIGYQPDSSGNRDATIVFDQNYSASKTNTISLPDGIDDVVMHGQGITGCLVQITHLSYVLIEGSTATSPANDSQFPQSYDDFITSMIPLGLVTPDESPGYVRVALKYNTSGNKLSPIAYNNTSTVAVPSSFQSVTSFSISSAGGQATLSYSSNQLNLGSFCSGRTVYIVGAAIPNSEITTRLEGLYTGPSYSLMAQIAFVESSYHQYFDSTLYGADALWPYESPGGGKYIGLMMVRSTIGDAWDWHQNTSDGVDLFVNDKLKKAMRYESSIRLLHPGLRTLTTVELENMATLLYGPGATAKLTEQYYAVDTSSGSPQWIVNAAGNSIGVAYVNKVRSSILPH